MTVLPSAIAATIAQDLTAAGGLTPHTTVLYAEPTVVPLDACPLLAVWTEQTEFDVLAGNPPAYARRHALNIAWYVYDANEADTGGTGDPATVQALEGTVAAIVARAETYTAGIPALSTQLVGTIRSSRVEPRAGACWQGLVELTVEEAA